MNNESATIELTMPPLPYYLGSGLSHFQTGDQHPNRRNIGLYDWILVVKGELHIGENGADWVLARGDCLLLLPDGEHYSLMPCTEETIFYWVHFVHHSGGEAAELSAKGPLYASRPFGNPHRLRLRKHARLANLQPFTELLEQLLQLPISSSFWEEQGLLSKLLNMLQDVRTGGHSSLSNQLAERTAAYIQHHYAEPVSNETLAAALHFHPNYIVRCMKEKFAQTPIEYLQAFRMDRAKRLLLTTEWTIERIAEEIGFRYAPYFSSRFKRSTGMSPLQFRKQYWH